MKQGDVALLGNITTSPYMGSFTKTINAAGTTPVTGVGFTPQSVFFFAASNNNTQPAAWGWSITPGGVGGNNRGINDNSLEITDSYSVYTAYSLTFTTGTSQRLRGWISSYDTDGFTVTWQLQGTPPATIVTVNFTAFR